MSSMPKQIDKLLKRFHLFVADSKLEDELEGSKSAIGMIGQVYQVMLLGGIFPKMVPKTKKSDKQSEQLRSKGNKSFSSKNFMEALNYYTEAVVNGKVDGTEIALAYGNRSAVTFSLGEFADSINDIDRALDGKYPQQLSFKLLERKGKCLSALKSYSKAIETFNAAIKALQSSNLDKKKCETVKRNIDKEIEKCKIQDDFVQTSESTNLPAFTHSPSSYIECASSAVDIEFSPDMGRLVVASTDIAPGDVIAVEKPFASTLLPSEFNCFCYYCKKRCHSMIPCLHCTLVLFCSEQCRENSWKETHGIGCEILPTLLSLGCDKMELLAVEVLMKMTNQGKNLIDFVEKEPEMYKVSSPKCKGFNNGKYLSNDIISIYNLETNIILRNLTDRLPRVVMAICILKIIISLSPYFDYVRHSPKLSMPIPNSDLIAANLYVGAYLLQYLCCIPSNAHELSEMRIFLNESGRKTESYEIGSGLFAFLSLINHSCDPNVVRIIKDGDCAVLIAIQAIKKGEQIYDNYGYHYAVHDVETRQGNLCFQYYFVCKCVACISNWPLYRNLPKQIDYLESADVKKVEKLKEKFNKILPKIEKGEIEDKLPFLYSYLMVLHNSLKRPWVGYCDCQEAIKECLVLQANHYTIRQSAN